MSYTDLRDFEPEHTVRFLGTGLAVSVDSAPPIVYQSEPMTDRDRALAHYRARNAQYDAARRIPGFEGYSPLPGFDLGNSPREYTARRWQ